MERLRIIWLLWYAYLFIKVIDKRGKAILDYLPERSYNTVMHDSE